MGSGGATSDNPGVALNAITLPGALNLLMSEKPRLEKFTPTSGPGGYFRERGCLRKFHSCVIASGVAPDATLRDGRLISGGEKHLMAVMSLRARPTTLRWFPVATACALLPWCAGAAETNDANQL